MEIIKPQEFLDYYEKVRQRTQKVIACIPAEKFDWRYAEGKFSFADIIRHLAAHPLLYGNGCAPWWSMRCIIARRFTFTWACWAFRRRRSTGSRQRKFGREAGSKIR